MYFIVLHQSHLLLSIIPITFQFFVSSSKVSPEPVSLTCFCSEEKSFKYFFYKVFFIAVYAKLWTTRDWTTYYPGLFIY